MHTTVYQFLRSVIDHYARISLYTLYILYEDQIACLSVFMDPVQIDIVVVLYTNVYILIEYINWNICLLKIVVMIE